jgi:hypothetical protein
MNDQNRNPLRSVAILEIGTALGLIGFWLAFFTVGLAPARPPVGYVQFEHSFPVPDLLVAGLFLVAGRCLLDVRAERRRLGRSLSLVCAGALMFLGALDISFNVQNGMYSISLQDTLLAVAINAWCVGFGAALMFRCSRSSGGPTTAPPGRHS